MISQSDNDDIKKAAAALRNAKQPTENRYVMDADDPRVFNPLAKKLVPDDLDEIDYSITTRSYRDLSEVQLTDMRLKLTNKAKQQIQTKIDAAVMETEKAYGGCHKCYGKGYATQDSATIGYPDFIGDKGFKRYEHKMIFCTCSRGKQLQQLTAPKPGEHPND